MIVNQPHDKQLGIQLIEALESEKYSQLTVMVAYAKLSGVYRLLPYIETFHKKGGTVRFVVGIDQQNTTYDALLQLHRVSDAVSVFHSESIAQTFHIKCYWLMGENECWYAIGSNNLTAGGLFSNYELCTIISTSGNEAISINGELDAIYRTYTDPNSVCAHEITDEFLALLLDRNYVIKEIQQRKNLVEAAKRTQTVLSKDRLFGNEVFPAPSLPAEFKRARAGHPAPSPKKKTVQQIPPAIAEKNENNYLIRHVPKAGGRSKQVHFTIDLLKKYFCLSPGDGILVQEMFPSGVVGEIEQRQVVFSQRNRNVKIELAGASVLNTDYPDNLDTRPVLILKRVNVNLFVYMLLLDGNDGYVAINDRLKSIPVGRSLPYEVIDESTMFSLWPECPIT